MTDSEGNTNAAAGLSFVLDTVAPEVVETPTGTLTETADTLSFGFSEPMSDSVLDPANYQLVIVGGDRDGESIAITGVTQALSPTGYMLQLGELLDDADYRLTINAGLADLAGNVTAEMTVAEFTMADPTGISEISPANGETLVNVARNTIVRFDEPIDPSTVTADAIYTIANGERLSATVRVSSTNRFVTLIYDQPLPASTEVRVVVDGDLLRGADGLNVDANGDGTPGGVATADFSTLSLFAIEGTNVFGFVKDSFTEQPIPGVTISLEAMPEIFAVTDENGRFELQNVPAPDFFVTIDGTTADALDGTRYAALGKAFHSVPGQTTQLNADGEIFDIFLPALAIEDVQVLSATETTEVGFGPSGVQQLVEMFPDLPPETWEGLGVEIAPGSALDQDGNAATQAFVIPVPPDRIPAPLPSNLETDLVVSLQVGGGSGFNAAGGANQFDVPAPVTLPNLAGLAPGEQNLIFWFNHDAGEWEAIGAGTVSADGLTITSNPGVGVNAPGWGFVPTQPVVPHDEDAENPCGDILGDAGQTLRQGMALILNGLSTSVSALDAVAAPINAVPIVGQFVDIGADGLSAILSLAAELVDDGEISASGWISIGNTITGGTAALFPAWGAALSTYTEAIGVSLGIISTGESAIATADALGDLGGSLFECAMELGGRAAETAGEIGDEIEDFREAYRQRLSDLQSAIEAAKRTVQAAQKIAKFAGEVFEYARRFGDGIPEINFVEDTSQLVPENNSEISDEQMQAFESLSTAVRDALPALDILNAGDRNSLESAILSTGNELGSNVKEVEGVFRVANTPAVNAFVKITDLSTGVELQSRTNDAGHWSMFLPTNSRFRVEIFDPSTGLFSNSLLTTGNSGQPSSDVKTLLPIDDIDSDLDRLVDIAEDIIGTDPGKPDTDADGILDGAEIEQGLDPLDGRAFPTGVIASLPSLAPPPTLLPLVPFLKGKALTRSSPPARTAWQSSIPHALISLSSWASSNSPATTWVLRLMSIGIRQRSRAPPACTWLISPIRCSQRCAKRSRSPRVCRR